MGQVSAPSGHLVRVAIRSPRRLFRDTLAVCLSGQPEFTVVGHVSDDAALLGLCDLCGPDLVVYDAGTGVGEALRALRTLRARYSRLRLVVIYDRLSPSDMSGSRQVGVDTLIPCSHGLDALLMLLHQHADALRSGTAVPVPGGVTSQEREIITLTAAGHPVSRIAELLNMTPFAVENCKRRIYQKLAVTSQSHAIARAITLGLVNRAPLPRPRVYAAGGLTLAVLCGPDVPARYDVAVALLAQHIPFVTDGGNGDEGLDLWDQAGSGTVPVILVDPTPAAWQRLGDARVPIMVVTSRQMSRGETLDALGRGLWPSSRPSGSARRWCRRSRSPRPAT
ncbi:response regulator transcription factor [Phytohabitans houttuyneae]|uniref:HTH luxR-type domain-containing protein n=1 Tax=Phytohabitans houttuyneae TaxID=1076126 RepID=A0A6V8KKS7_9ACTN|nr:response regulator transcription factor [Phytohabitans houttuyneae]GFJ83108.1 hypothetical protein Phou_072880 [Phytohabitans houttuyneae]